MKKRLLSLALALIMLTGLVPTAALADELPPEPTPTAAEQPVPETPVPVMPAPAQPTVEPAQPSAEPVQPSAEPTTPAQPQETPAVEPEEGSEEGESSVPSPSAKPEDDAEAEENDGEAEAEPSPSPSAAPQIAVQRSENTLTLYFSSGGGSGYMSPKYYVPFDQDYTLPACTFTREGYTFEYWQAGSGANIKKFYPGQPFYCGFDESYLYDYDDYWEEYDVYLTAVWKADPVAAAFSAIETALGDKTVRKTGSLGLPASNDEYTVSYDSSDTAFISKDGNVLALPESGTVTVTLTATVTPTDGEAQTREYTLTLYSEEAVEAETMLNGALSKLPGVFAPVYGTDTNANAYIKSKLGSAYADVAVSVKSVETYDGCSVDASDSETNGNIEYFYNEAMEASKTGCPRITFKLTYKGVSVERELSSSIPWDRAKVEVRLTAELDRVSLPAELTEDGTLSLPQYMAKEGVTDPDYDDFQQLNIWGKITWTSSNTKAIGNFVAGGYYNPYTADVKQQKDDVTVTLTATITWGTYSSKLTKDRTFEIVVKGNGIDEAQVERDELMIRLETGLSNPGLKDNATLEALDYANVINNIRFPLPKQYKLNTSNLNTSKYAVTITSSDACIIPPKGNATIGTVTRPLAGEDPVRVKLTVTITKKADPDIFASKDIWVTVQPIVNEEIDRELALMEYVKAHYFDGIKNKNTDPGNITTDLHPFTEAHYNDAGEVVWEYTSKDVTNDGIVPVAMDGWYESEQWRTFRSSNPAVITHENLLVTRAKEHKSVTITSWLSSERYETLAEKYKDTDTRLAKLINQEVSIELTVTGTDPTTDKPDKKGLTVGFTLADNGNVWLSCRFTGLNEGVTVYDVFYRALGENGFSAAGGGFVTAVSGPNGTLSQKDRGEYSGWMYSVNGAIPNIVMAQYYLSDGDQILFFYTDDYTKISGMAKPAVTVDEVIRLIDEIGKVTLRRGDAIAAARAAYDKLSEKDRAKVTNAEVLFADERAYAALIKSGEKCTDILKTTGDFVLSDDEEKLSGFGSEWLIMGLSRAGRDVPEDYVSSAEEYVRKHADSRGRLSAERATDNARLILALSALGEDVTDFGGHDLLAPLGNMDYIEKQGLSGVVYTLLALDCRDYDVPAAPDGARQTTREALVNYLLDKQLDDGGWAFSGDEAEPDMTAMVLQSLAAYYADKPADKLERAVKKAVDDGVARLSAMQTGTGGYVSYGTLNSESAAQVIVALTALGIDPAEDARFVKNGTSVVDALCAFYVDGGGFRHSMDGEREELATAQGYYALAAYYRFTEGKTALFDMSDVSAPASTAKAA